MMPFGHLAEYSQHLGREVTPGLLGENLTVEGPTENQLCIGSQLHIGKILLEVTKPRRPCSKLAVFLGVEAVHFMIQTGYSGWYCRVVEGGRIAAGAEVQISLPASGQTVLERFSEKMRQKPNIPGLD